MLHNICFASLILVTITYLAPAQEASVTSPALHTLIEKSPTIVVARLEEGQGVAQGGGELITDKYSVAAVLKGKMESGKTMVIQRHLPLGMGEKLQTNVRPQRIGDTFVIFISSVSPNGNATVTDVWLGIQPHDRALESAIKTAVK